MAACLTDEELLGFVGGAPLSDTAEILSHLATCSMCRVLVAEATKGLEGTSAKAELSSRSEGDFDGGPADPYVERPVSSSSDDASEHARVGRYQLRGILGAGGAGVVYEAYDPQLARRVALKLLRADPTNGQARTAERLLREAKVMAQLSHQNVVPVFDAGTFEHGVFIAMEFVDGLTLRQWLEGSPPETRVHDWREIARQFLAAGRGLVAAHMTGLVHGDFKADNVLIGNDGRPRVTDFGLARRAAIGEPDLTTSRRMGLPQLESTVLTLSEAGGLAGTPAYMAPEQFRGNRADEKTDQFNFCASLFSALYGFRPFEPEGGARSVLAFARTTLKGQLRRPPPESPVPPTTFAVLARGLSTSREERFPDLLSLLAALEATVEGSRDELSLHRFRRPVAWALGLGAVSMATLLALSVGRDARYPSRDNGPEVRHRTSEADRNDGFPSPRSQLVEVKPVTTDPDLPRQGVSSKLVDEESLVTKINVDGQKVRRRPKVRRLTKQSNRRDMKPSIPASSPRALGDGLKNPYHSTE